MKENELNIETEEQNKRRNEERRLASLITRRCFTSTAGGSPDFLKMTGSTIAECSVSTSSSQSQVNDSVATAEQERGMSGGRTREGRRGGGGWHSATLRPSLQLH